MEAWLHVATSRTVCGRSAGGLALTTTKLRFRVNALGESECLGRGERRNTVTSTAMTSTTASDDAQFY